MNTLLAEISSAAKEQSTGISEINSGVTELDKVTQQNAGNAEELASAAQETASQVATLREVVSSSSQTQHLKPTTRTLEQDVVTAAVEPQSNTVIPLDDEEFSAF
ncbi:MAG: hypothetical protein Phyf2KO_09600 [Phycisphaerales bacterium]